MSAICSLYSGNEALPLWTKYEEGEVQLLESNYLVPIFWLGLFTENHLVVWLDPDGDSEDLDDNRVPTLIRVKDKCISTFLGRQEFLGEIFSKSRESFDEFIGVLEKSEGKYISVDMTELFYSVENQEEFILDLQNILKFFDGKEIDKVPSLLRMADIQKYETEEMDFLPNDLLNYEYHLMGMENS